MKVKIFLVVIISLFLSYPICAQKIDSIYFHLYTDSLKKGRHNYINVDGKLSNGKWLPLSDKEIQFTSSHGVFINSDLILPADFAEDKVTVKASLKTNPSVQKEITIWIKKNPEPVNLPTKEDVLNNRKSKNKNGKDN